MVWMYQKLKLSLVEGHMDCFHVSMTVTNTAAVNISCIGFCVNVHFHFPRINV